ncbi:hypothetical protein C8J56DRAFT_773237 [Mycena floridula]|nr:hypothetical protein C8J56DRAFT_773237 [Mycena floridula]
MLENEYQPPPDSPLLSPLASAQDTTQLDILVRLRIIHQLQAIAYTGLNVLHDPNPDILIDVLDWICTCLATGPAKQSIAAGLAAQPGLITLYLAHHSSDSEKPASDSLMDDTLCLIERFRDILDKDASPQAAFQMFMDIFLQKCQAKVTHKLLLLSETGGSPGETSYRFGILVSLWLLYRPEGEKSKSVIDMAGVDRANEYLNQLFLTLVHQDYLKLESMTPEARSLHLVTLINHCCILMNSSFFDDIFNRHSFLRSLKAADCKWTTKNN